MTTDPSATLSAIRERAHELTIDLPQEDHCGSVPCTGHDALRLVMLAEAVLALAGKWDRVDARLGEIGRDSAPVGDLRREMAFSHAKIFEDCAAALREAITSALTGEPANPSAPAAGTGEGP